MPESGRCQPPRWVRNGCRRESLRSAKTRHWLQSGMRTLKPSWPDTAVGQAGDFNARSPELMMVAQERRDKKPRQYRLPCGPATLGGFCQDLVLGLMPPSVLSGQAFGVIAEHLDHPTFR